MAKLTSKEVKEKLNSKESFSAFVYLENGNFSYDTELKDNVIGVISTDVYELLDILPEDDEELSVVEHQIKYQQEIRDNKRFYFDTDNVHNIEQISEEELTSGLAVINVSRREFAKDFNSPTKVKNWLLDELNTRYFTDITNYYQVKETDDLIDDLNLDSLDRLDFIIEVEKTLGISVPDNVSAAIFARKEFRNINWISNFLASQIDLELKTS